MPGVRLTETTLGPLGNYQPRRGVGFTSAAAAVAPGETFLLITLATSDNLTTLAADHLKQLGH